jgi:hypothetical protein
MRALLRWRPVAVDPLNQSGLLPPFCRHQTRIWPYFFLKSAFRVGRVRMQPQQLAALDAWITAQADAPSAQKLFVDWSNKHYGRRISGQ